MDPKAEVVSAIARAQLELEYALDEIGAVTATDPDQIVRVAHALGNYTAVTSAAIDMLQARLAGHPDGDVAIWLDSVQHAAELMQHSIGRLVSNVTPQSIPLKPDRLDLHVFMERACQYYRRRVEGRDVRITCMAIGDLPMVFADRVVLAIVADNLLGHAVAHAQPRDTIRVQMTTGPAGVLCRIQRSAAGLTPQETELLGAAAAAVAADNPPEDDLNITVAEEFLRRLGGELWFERVQGRRAYGFSLPAAPPVSL